MEINDYNAKPGKTIGRHCQELVERLELLRKYHYIEEEKLYNLVKYACLHHDDGKVNEEFQKRVREERKKIRFNKEKEIPHNILSIYMLNPDDFKYGEEERYKVLHAILNHHDYGNPYDIMNEKAELIQYLLRDFPTYRISARIKREIAKRVYDLDAIKIKGFLHKCDYSASGNYVVEYPNDFLEASMDNIKKKWQKSDPNSDWNKMQKFCMQKRNQNIIIVAQTGMGKTEAGFQWIGNHKGYFVLPLRTAINAIYDRVRNEIFQDEKIDERIAILHSESLEYYTEKIADKELDIFDYENKGKKFCLPLSISTMDQLFDFIFKYQGFELKLTTLSYSRIVIDEIQMYDPHLLSYLIYGLKLICQMGGRIAIMTATLSPFVKELLMREISFKEENIEIFVEDSIRHNITVYDYRINIDDIIEKYQENIQLAKSNKILVVCNTVKKAQELYQELLEYVENVNKDITIHLLHSRYTRKDRRKLENEILKFGRTYAEDGRLDVQSGIWISTSLIEASLDIDFDYLFTELQDLNSLFQRLGRCNRKGEKDISQTNCYVYTEIDKNLLVGSNAFIDNTIFRLSKEALQTVDGKLSETKKIDLLNDFLTLENLKQSDYYRKYKENDWIKNIEPYKFEKKQNQLRDILSKNIIPSPVYKEHKNEIEKWEKCLLKEGLTYVERVKVRMNILQYSVSIPYWEWILYQNAVSNERAEYYPQIQLGYRESIQVVECLYDEQGYRKMDYKNVIRATEFL